MSGKQPISSKYCFKEYYSFCENVILYKRYTVFFSKIKTVNLFRETILLLHITNMFYDAFYGALISQWDCNHVHCEMRLILSENSTKRSKFQRQNESYSLGFQPLNVELNSMVKEKIGSTRLSFHCECK